MRFRGVGRALVATAALALAITGSATAADETRGIDPNEGRSLVEVILPSKADAIELQLKAETYGIEFNDHYLAKNANDSVTVQVFADEDQLAALEAAGYELGQTIESVDTWWDRLVERQADINAEARADKAALGVSTLRRGKAAIQTDQDEIVVLRVDYFTNYAGHFLSVEAKTRLATLNGSQYTGPTLSLSWNTGAGTPIDKGPRTMNLNIDPDTSPDTYIEHRELVRIGDGVAAPTLIRIGSSSGASKEAPVETWLGGGLPPMASTYQSGFVSRYMDPTEVKQRFTELAAEFPNIATLVPLPHKTNGYQRRAQANLAANATTLSAAAAAGATAVRVSSTTGLLAGQVISIDNGANQERRTIASVVTPNPASPAPNVNLTAPLALAHASGVPFFWGESGSGNTAAGNSASSALVITSRAWGHEGGNDVTVELRDPAAANSPLSVAVLGTNILVSLGTDAEGDLASTAVQVIEAINANAAASALVKAATYRGNAGTGVVQPRTKVNLSDFLQPVTPMGRTDISLSNDHVKRGPFQQNVLRIRRTQGGPTGPKVGVFLYCQQHAREWATPITCLETAEQLLRNYATDEATHKLVDNLDIFILPSSNPDGGHHSMYNFGQQRRNMTNHCVNGGKTTDNPFAADFWTPRINPSTGAPYTNNDPASRTAWGVDENRNNTFATIFDGFIGASHSCTSDTYAGPSEASEPEIKNELWVADTFPHIKFSNNIHSSGGYFMWAPGAYLPDRGEGAAVHANIGVEKYFFEAGAQILNRIKEVRGTAILPERTGPIADVLYSAAGNSADEHWYNRGVIAYSFEVGADRFVNTTLSVASEPGATGIRPASRTGFQPGDTITFDKGTATEEIATVLSVAASAGTSPAPNVTLTAPLQFAHAAGGVLIGGIFTSGVGFQPAFEPEGRGEYLEFSAGNFGLLESAYQYAKDNDPPKVVMTGAFQTSCSPRPCVAPPIDSTFQYVNEPSVIRYTTDGSAPNANSTLWDSTGPREPGEVFHIDKTTTFRWLATDIKGNTSTGSKRFFINSKP
jgi:hypothetical protein